MLTVQIQDEEALVSSLLDAIKDSAQERVGAVLFDHVREVVRDEMKARIREITNEAIQAEVHRVLAEGWPKTNNYGEATGERVTLNSFVLTHLTKGDNFGNRPIDRFTTEAVNAALKGEIGKVIAEAAQKVRGTVDAAFADRLRSAVVGAISGK